MNIKILFKLLLIVLITSLQLQANVIINLALSGTLLTAASITGIQAKKTWDKLQTNEIILDAREIISNSGSLIKAMANEDQKALSAHAAELKNRMVSLKDKAGPTTGWATATVVCAGLCLRLFLSCI